MALVPLIEYAQARAEVRAVYDDIMTSRIQFSDSAGHRWERTSTGELRPIHDRFKWLRALRSKSTNKKPPS